MHKTAVVALLLICANAAANEVQYGHFEVTSSAAELMDREMTDAVSEFMDVEDDIVWKMYVPESYNPDLPAGLMVYISPNDTGWMPRPWQAVIADENLIWISANSSGNEQIVARRMIYAVLAPQIAATRYQLDSDRVYLSGFSGGGKVSGMVAISFANLFKGALYICGAEYWVDESAELFPQIKNNRYVFLTGTEDFNRELTYRIFRKYESAGVTNIELIKVPRMAHKNPDTLYFRKAVNFLDQRE